MTNLDRFNAIHFAGTDLLISSANITLALFTDLCDCGGSGDATEAVEYVMSQYDITGNEADCRAYLRECGAWDDAELQDHDANLRRLVWLTGCALREDNEAYFSAY